MAARCLARADSHSAAILGAGRQAQLQLEALTLVRDIDSATLWARDFARAEAAAATLGKRLGIAVRACDNIAAATADADIIVTTTPATRPLLLAEHVKPGQHITAMGADSEHKNEIDPRIVASSKYFCDRLSQVQALGELHHAIEQSLVGAADTFPEINQVIAHRVPGRVDTDEITLCDLTGTGIQDTAIATLAYRLCQQHKARHRIYLIESHHMPKDATLNFSVQEYAARLAKTRATMVDKNIDCLLVVDPSNMAWLSGYDGWSFYTHQCLIVQHDHEPIWWGRGIDAPGAVRTTWLDADNILKYPDHFVQSDVCHPMDHLSELLAELKLERGTIGVEMENYYFSAAAFVSLQTHLPNATLLDATALVNWQRLIKSDQEISYMRSAARIVEAMHARIYEIIEPGLAKNELAAEIFHTGILGNDEHWGDYPAIMPLLPTGMDATAAHLTWDNSRLKPGDITFFEIAGCHKRYHCPLSRTISLGKPPQKYLDAETAVLDAMHAGLENARPGKTCEDIAIAFFDTLEKHGFHKDNRTGYSIGLSYPPDWGERTMSLRRGDKTELRPNMTFHFMPALWLDDGGLEITESVVINDNGYESLAQVEQRLLVK